MLNFKKTKSNAFKCVAAVLLVLTIAMVGLVGCGEEELPTVSGIAISAQPTKVQYEVGEKFDYTGAKIKVTYDDGTSEEVDVTASMIDLYSVNFDKKGSQNITVTYTAADGTTKTAVIAVTVIDTLGDKKAAQIKAINDYTDLKDSAIVALKATYINSVNAADDAAEIDATVKAYKDAVDAYKTASEALTKAITDAKATINNTKVDDIPASLKPTVASYKEMSLAALELAATAEEAKGIADAYVKAVAEVKKDLAYRLEVDAAAIEKYTELCEEFYIEETTRAKYYLAADWAKIVALYEDAKAVVLRADDLATIEEAGKTLDTEIAKIESVLDKLFALIKAFEAKALENAGGKDFVVYAFNTTANAGSYKAELDAVLAAYAEIKADAIASEGLAAYTDRAGMTYDLNAIVAEYDARYNTELPAALAAAPAVVDTIKNLNEVKLYEQFKESSIEGMNPAYYVTVKSDLTAAVAAVDAWLAAYEMAWAVDEDDATKLVPVATYADATVLDPNVADMITNIDVFAALVERQAALKDSAKDLFETLFTVNATDKTIVANLEALLYDDTDTDDYIGYVDLNDEEALAALEAAVAEWLDKYDLEPARIADYVEYKYIFVAEDLTADPVVAEESVTVKPAEAYAAIRAQRVYMEDMKDAKAEYDADLKAMFEAFVAKNPLYNTAYETEIKKVNSTMSDWVVEYSITEENVILIVGMDALNKYEACWNRYADLALRAAVKSYVVDKIAALQAEIDANTDKKITLDEIEELVAAEKALTEWAEGSKPTETADQKKDENDQPMVDEDNNPVYDLTTRIVVDQPNIEAILGTDYTKLVDARKAFNEIIAAYADDVKAVNDKIAAIGTVTKDSEATIDAAREAFNAFIAKIDEITETLSAEDIAAAFEIDLDTLVEAEGKLVDLYIADLGNTTEFIPVAIKAIEKYIDWSGFTTVTGGKIADIIKAIKADATNIEKFPVYYAIFTEIAAVKDNDAIEKFDDMEEIVDELAQLCAECGTLNSLIADLPELAAITLNDEAYVLLALDVYSSFLNNNGKYNADIIGESKLQASADRIEELKFKALIAAYVVDINAERDNALAKIDPSTKEGSVWYNSVEKEATKAELQLKQVAYDSVNADAVAAEIAQNAIKQIRDHLTSYEETIG